MILTDLSLTHFRNHAKRQISFDPTVTLLIGPNGVGKTNIVEAIYLLGRGESWRASDVSKMVGFGSEVAHVDGKVAERLTGQQANRKENFKLVNLSTCQPVNLHAILTRGLVNSEPVAKTKFLVDGIARHKADFASHLKIVLFEPESLEIIIGDPGRRRGFLDEALSQTDHEYARSLAIYVKALRTRNRLLQAIREGKAKLESLEFWEREMAKHGMVIQRKRQEIVEWLDCQMIDIDSKGPTSIGPTSTGESLFIAYDASVISAERLNQYRDREIAAGFTLIGPQRDEIQIDTKNGKDDLHGNDGDHLHYLIPLTHSLSSFGSRGQQRMAVLKLKLLEAEWIEKETGDSPIILLDDIFSELDSEHEEMAGKLIEGRQTIITATDVRKNFTPSASIIDLI